MSGGAKNPLRGRLQSKPSGGLERGCYLSTFDSRLVDFKELDERTTNVIENKGPLRKTEGKAGMSLKTNVLILLMLVSYSKQSTFNFRLFVWYNAVGG